MANTDYGAVLLTTCEATSQALNHRLGVSTGFKPSEWADNINLLVKPAEKSASGSVAHFTDGLDMPLVSLSCDVTAWQEGTGTASPSNPRPIHGFNSADIVINAKNFIPKNYDVESPCDLGGGVSLSYDNNGKVYINGTGTGTSWGSANLKSFKLPAGQFVFSASQGSSNTRVWLLKDGTNIKSYAEGDAPYVFTADAHSVYTIQVRAQKNQSYSNEEITFQIELGSSATSFEKYTGTSLNIPFGQTVYGGRLNVMTGELTITHGYILLKDQTFSFTKSASTNFDTFYLNVKTLFTGVKQTDYADFVCDKFNGTTTQSLVVNDAYIQTGWLNIRVTKDEYDTGTAFTNWVKENGLYIAYELATPTTITLTPHQMSSLLGENNIWADCGDSAVVYRGMVGNSFKCFFNSQVTSGWTGTSAERTMLTITAKSNGSITFGNKGTGRTNCGSNDGYIVIRKNGTDAWKKTLTSNTDIACNDIPKIDFVAGDVITLTFGFANYHSNINIKLVGDSFTIIGSTQISGISNTTNTTTTIEIAT